MHHNDVDTVLEWLLAVSGGDVDRALSFSAPNVRIIGPRGAGEGRELLRDWLTRAGATLTRRAVYARNDMVVVDQHGVWPQGEADIATRFRVAHEEVAELERFDTLEAALAAAGLTSNDLIPASRLQYVGYWFRTLDPRHLVDPQWARDERSALIRYLTDGHTLAECLGSSYCRFKCGIADSQTGCRDLTDGTWVWPEGLAHYVKAHNIMLPDELLAHARANGFEMPALDPLLAAELENPRRGYDLDLVVSDELWQRWGREHSHR